MKRLMDLKCQTFRYLGVTAALVLATASAPAAQTVPPGSLPFGVYDPNGDFTDLNGVSIEHLFLPWEDVLLSSLEEAEDYAKARDRTLLVTIEPWSATRHGCCATVSKAVRMTRKWPISAPRWGNSTFR